MKSSCPHKQPWSGMGSIGGRGSDDPSGPPTPWARDAPWDTETRGTGLNPFPVPIILTASPGRKKAQQLNMFGHHIWEISFRLQFLPLNIRLGTFSSQLGFFGKMKDWRNSATFKNKPLKKVTNYVLEAGLNGWNKNAQTNLILPVFE